MSKGKSYDDKFISKKHIHFGWNNSLEPILTVNTGEEITVEMIDASGGQINTNSTEEDVASLNFDKVNPVTGPIYIKGAEAGDILVVDLKEFTGSSWGWTANIPGFGLLADEFPEPFLNISEYNQDWVYYTPEIRLPYSPFAGTIGVAPATAGTQSVVFPRNVGGNMDIRHLTTGSKLYLPVEVQGGLFSVGDGHATQGDGEVCGTAVETALNLRLSFDLIKGVNIKSPQFETKLAFKNIDSEKEDSIYVTTGIAPDLMAAARDAVRYMIDYLMREYKLDAVIAYSLCSVAADLKISEVVDAPNWIVTAHLNKAIFI